MSNHGVTWTVSGLTTHIDSFSGTTVDNGDYGPNVCQNVATVADEVWTKYLSDIIYTCSCGGRDLDSPPVISITFVDGIDTSPSALRDYTTFLTSRLQFYFYSSVSAVVQNSTRFYDLSARNKENASFSRSTEAHIAANKSIRAFHLSVNSFETDVALKVSPTMHLGIASLIGTIASNIPVKDIVHWISTTAGVADRMLNSKPATASNQMAAAENDQAQDPDIPSLKESIDGIVSALYCIGSETNTTAIVNHMIHEGIVTIGPSMWEAYKACHQDFRDTATLVPYLVKAAGGARAIAPHAALLANTINTFYLHKFGAKNLLLAANTTPTAFTFAQDAVGDGERDMITPQIPECPSHEVEGEEIKLAIPCGFYAYGQYRPDCRGPWHGLTFNNSQAPFSVGMSCQNQSTGNANAIYLKKTSDAEGVATLARDTSSLSSQSSISLPSSIKCVGKRCHMWGNTNVGFLSMTKS